VPPPGLSPRLRDAWVAGRLQAWILAQERALLGPVPPAPAGGLRKA